MKRSKTKCHVCGRIITVKIGVGPGGLGRGCLMWHKLSLSRHWCPGSDTKPEVKK